MHEQYCLRSCSHLPRQNRAANPLHAMAGAFLSSTIAMHGASTAVKTGELPSARRGGRGRRCS